MCRTIEKWMFLTLAGHTMNGALVHWIESDFSVYKSITTGHRTRLTRGHRSHELTVHDSGRLVAALREPSDRRLAL